MTRTRRSYLIELARKSGGTHIRTITRKIRKSLLTNTSLKDDEALARKVAIGVIRKGNRYVPPQEWYDMLELRRRISECGRNNRKMTGAKE